jgi:hypothetical protein
MVTYSAVSGNRGALRSAARLLVVFRDVMTTTLIRCAVSALLAGGMALAAANAADAGSTGAASTGQSATSAEFGAASDSASLDAKTRHGGEPTGVASNAKGNVNSTGAAGKSGEPTAGGAVARNTAARNAQLTAVRGRSLIPRRSDSGRAYAKVPATASSGARGPVGRSDAIHPSSRSNLAKGDMRGTGAATASASASRQFSGGLPNRPAASFKAVAGNSVIGGPHAPGRSTVGGPAMGRTVARSGLDGTAMRRRF